jgi:DNA (cytosine-5)-methyltransferase 1
LFIIGIRSNFALTTSLANDGPMRSSPWQPRGLLNAFEKLPPKVREKWIWWNLPMPLPRNVGFADLIDDDPLGVEWHTVSETANDERHQS